MNNKYKFTVYSRKLQRLQYNHLYSSINFAIIYVELIKYK